MFILGSYIDKRTLCSVHRTPEYLSFAVTDVILGKKRLSALMNPGNSLSFVNKETVKSLYLPIHPSSHNVPMEVGSLKVPVLGHCSSEITLMVQCTKMSSWKLGDTCIVTFCWGKTSSGSTDALCLRKMAPSQSGNLLAFAWKLCGHGSSSRVPLVVLQINPNCHPVAVPSRRYTVHSSALIESKVKKLCAQGIIRPSNSPWRASTADCCH